MKSSAVECKALEALFYAARVRNYGFMYLTRNGKSFREQTKLMTFSSSYLAAESIYRKFHIRMASRRCHDCDEREERRTMLIRL